MKYEKTHGMSKSRTYMTWASMKQRTLNKNHKQFHMYGGRGISVCDSWIKFENFYADMGDCPDGLTLERTDNNAGYSKSNCVWASMKTQARNRRNSVLLTIDGATKCLAEWSEETGIPHATLLKRVNKGMSDSDVIHIPVKKKNELIEYDGIKLTFNKWCERLGIKAKTMSQRINGYGWSIEKAFSTPVKGST